MGWFAVVVVIGILIGGLFILDKPLFNTSWTLLYKASSGISHAGLNKPSLHVQIYRNNKLICG